MQSGGGCVKRWLMIFLMLIIVFVAIACSPNDSGIEQKTKRPTLTLGILPDVDSIPFIIAQEKGFFREHNLTVKLQSFTSAINRDSALQSANLDGAVSDMLAAAFAKDGGFNISMTSLTNGSYKILAHPSAGTVSIVDLKTKTVGISKNTLIEYLTDTMLTAAGLHPSNVQKIIISQMPARLELLNSGKIAAATLPEPLASIAIKNGAKLLGSSDSLGINPGVLVFTASAIREKSQEIQAMYQAYNKAVGYLSSQLTANDLDLIIEKGGFPASVKGHLVIPAYTQAAVPDPQELESVLQWMQSRQLIKKTYTYQELVDTRFAR